MTIIDVTEQQGVQTWFMDFAPANALHPDFVSVLQGSLDDALADTSVAVVVLTSSLRVFSAGADANWMGELLDEGGPAHLLTTFNTALDRVRDLCIRMRRSDVLFVAALNGHTLAGGLELAAACDLRFASDDDRIQIGVPEMRHFGVLPSGAGGAQFLARLMGPARALDFILEGETYSPAQAKEHGIVERLYSASSLVAETQSFAERVAGRAGRIGVNAAKRSILDGVSMSIYEGLELDRSVHWDAMRRGSFLPGVEKFVQQFASREGK